MNDSVIYGRLLLGKQLIEGRLHIAEGRIAAVHQGAVPPHGALHAPIVSPGFVDLQVNGGFGVEVDDDEGSFRRLASCLPETGVTAFLPTTVSSPADFYPPVIETFQRAEGAPGARMLGFHIEGPLISVARKGAHRPEVIAAADPTFLDTLLSPGVVRIVTVAPERPGVIERIPTLTAGGVVVSLGHSDADCDTFRAGVDAGAAMATHLFNAMSPFEHRAPGVAGAVLTDDRVTAGLIADGVHTHPLALDLAVRAKGIDRIVLVTDMMSATGLGPGRYTLGGQTVVVDEASARLENGTLAGSILTMNEAVRNMVRWAHVSIGKALYMATTVPARLINANLGRIAVGLPADLVLLDGDLQVQRTLVGGEVVYSREAVAQR